MCWEVYWCWAQPLGAPRQFGGCFGALYGCWQRAPCCLPGRCWEARVAAPGQGCAAGPAWLTSKSGSCTRQAWLVELGLSGLLRGVGACKGAWLKGAAGTALTKGKARVHARGSISVPARDDKARGAEKPNLCRDAWLELIDRHCLPDISKFEQCIRLSWYHSLHHL